MDESCEWVKLHALLIFPCNFPFSNGIFLGKCLSVNLSNEEGLNDLLGKDVTVSQLVSIK